MRENLSILFQSTENALIELRSNSIPFLSIETLTLWINKYKKLEYETIIFDFFDGYTNDFSLIFFHLEKITELATKMNEIIDCINDFKKINTKNFNETLKFLNTHQDLLFKCNLPDLQEVDDKYYALSNFEYLKFKKEELELLVSVEKNIASIYRLFYVVKLYNNDDAYLKVLEEIIEIN